MRFLFFMSFVLIKENYEKWSNKKKEELISKGRWEIVECGYEWPKEVKYMIEKESEAFTSLKKKDLQAFMVLSENVDKEVLCHINGEKSAKDSWDLLKEVYGKNEMENMVEARMRSDDDNEKEDEIEEDNSETKNVGEREE